MIGGRGWKEGEGERAQREREGERERESWTGKNPSVLLHAPRVHRRIRARVRGRGRARSTTIVFVIQGLLAPLLLGGCLQPSLIPIKCHETAAASAVNTHEITFRLPAKLIPYWFFPPCAIAPHTHQCVSSLVAPGEAPAGKQTAAHVRDPAAAPATRNRLPAHCIAHRANAVMPRNRSTPRQPARTEHELTVWMFGGSRTGAPHTSGQ